MPRGRAREVVVDCTAHVAIPHGVLSRKWGSVGECRGDIGQWPEARWFGPAWCIQCCLPGTRSGGPALGKDSGGNSMWHPERVGGGVARQLPQVRSEDRNVAPGRLWGTPMATSYYVVLVWRGVKTFARAHKPMRSGGKDWPSTLVVNFRHPDRRWTNNAPAGMAT